MVICAVCGKEVSRYIIQLTFDGESAIVCHDDNRASHGYKPFEKYLDTNIPEQPVFIENDRQREKLMKERGLSVRPREHLDDLNHRRWTKGLPPVRK